MVSVMKTGYKQTEIGIIPEDWEVRKLDECLTLLTDFEANGSFEDVAKNGNYSAPHQNQRASTKRRS